MTGIEVLRRERGGREGRRDNSRSYESVDGDYHPKGKADRTVVLMTVAIAHVLLLWERVRWRRDPFPWLADPSLPQGEEPGPDS